VFRLSFSFPYIGFIAPASSDAVLVAMCAAQRSEPSAEQL
jgi:hypothetical protein